MPNDLAHHPPAPVSLFNAFLYWLKLGFISFGGPAGQISMMHQELVEKRRWISERRFLHALNFTMVLPGPEAQQLATYIGWLMHGTRGGIIAGVLFVLPSLFILIALTWLYLNYGDVPLIAGVLYGIKPAVTAIVLFAAYRIGSRALTNPILKLLALLSFIAIFALSVPFPLIILSAALIGFIGSRLNPTLFDTKVKQNDYNTTYGPALIDDETPLPAHMQMPVRRLITRLVTGVLIWLVAMGLLVHYFDLHGTLTQMGWFFSKAALVTFGGAYAVLPYVYQGGVEHFAWLSGPQMIDGLALGETTPGPLIMIVAFIGFVGGWNSAIFGADWITLSAIAGASIATFFTFLPSFILILIGAPMIEASRHALHFTAPLRAITAAVVGVIINLAFFFAQHVLWPDGFANGLDLFSALIGALAMIVLFHFNLSIIKVIILSALLGLLNLAFT